ncbi:MAG TPA: histidine phosphatase family protein, partial [Arachidicoccus sp.]|nr:histidine phosphatase family protein [Arachidicoccus sp.]
MLEVFFLRHGQTTWNAEGNRYCGRTDIELTQLGVKQAAAVGKQLTGLSFDQVFSSPLKRAYDTATIACNGIAVTKEPRLIEVDFGLWEGKRREEFVLEDPVTWTNWANDPGNFPAGGTGETAMAVIERVDAFFRDAIKRFPAGRIMIVAHNGVNRLYLAWKLGMPLKNYRQLVQDNSTITMFTLDKEGV